MDLSDTLAKVHGKERDERERAREIEGAGQKKIEFYNKFCTGQKSLKIGGFAGLPHAACLPREATISGWAHVCCWRIYVCAG